MYLHAKTIDRIWLAFCIDVLVRFFITKTTWLLVSRGQKLVSYYFAGKWSIKLKVKLQTIL